MILFECLEVGKRIKVLACCIFVHAPAISFVVATPLYPVTYLFLFTRWYLNVSFVWFYARFPISLFCLINQFLKDPSNTHQICFWFQLICMPTMQLVFPFIVLLICSLSIASAGPLEQISARSISPDNTCGKNGTGGGADGYTCPSSLPCCSGK